MEATRPEQGLARAVERVLLAIGGGLLIAPLALTVLFGLLPTLWPGATWLHDTTLAGVVRPAPVRFSWPALLHARYQQGLEHSFDQDFPGRELLIRLANEAWLRAFGVSGMTNGERIVVGRGRTLFLTNDVKEYCRPRPPEHSLELFAGQIARLQTSCRQRGLAFAVLISPSKSLVYPEDIPQAWLDRLEKRPRAYNAFRRALAGHGIATVDGQAITLQAKSSAPAPLFARGGTHWNAHAAFLTGNALLAALRSQGKPVEPMELADLRVGDEPHGNDADLLDLMNLALPWRYPVADIHLRRKRLAENARLNAVFVGDSFTERLAELFSECGQFAEVDYFFYYRGNKRSYTDAGATYTPPGFPVDFERDVFSADILVLEINEAQLSNAAFARDFVADAMSRLDTPARPRPLFPASDAQAYTWGEQLRFEAGTSGEIDRRALRGFSSPEPDGTWTEGTPAAVCLLATPPPGDLILDADVAALADPARRLAQEAEVSVNDEPLDRWEFSTLGMTHRRLVIPRRLLDGTRHVLQFRILHPTSPAEIGLGPDTRRLGLRFSTLRLQPAPARP